MYGITGKRVLLAACLISTSGQAADNLLLNGNFLGPKPPAGTILLVDSGERYGVWRVDGASGNISHISGSYTHHGFTFPAWGNGDFPTTHAWVNLAGISQTATGITHAPIAVTQGATYTLSFYVGNIYAPGDIYGTTSTVKVYQNSNYLGSFTNSNGQGTKKEVWKKFTVSYVADAPYTNVAFINGDPPGDMNCGIDNIQLVAGGTAP